jgi:hypothetical protein
MCTIFTTPYTLHTTSTSLSVTSPIHSKTRKLKQCHLFIYFIVHVSKLSVFETIQRRMIGKKQLNFGTTLRWVTEFKARPLYPSLPPVTNGWEPEPVWTFRRTKHRRALGDNRTTCLQSCPSNYTDWARRVAVEQVILTQILRTFIQSLLTTRGAQEWDGRARVG